MTADRATAGIVIAVRGGPLAKTRCAAVLSPVMRARLVEAMLDDMLDAVLASPATAAVHVVTPTEQLAQRAERRGAHALREPAAGGINAAFDYARHALAPGFGGILVLLPGDLPGLTAAELSTLVAACTPGRVVLVPATMDAGTGALALPPGCTMPTQFGPGSFQRHHAAAMAAGFSVHVAALPGIGLDIDRPADFEAIGRCGGTAYTSNLLRCAGRGTAQVGGEQVQEGQGSALDPLGPRAPDPQYVR